MPRLNKNIKIFFNYFLGPALFVWMSVSIYNQVTNQPHLESSWNRVSGALQGDDSWIFWVVLALMPVNWGIEARKWQVILRPLEKISIVKAYKAILAGVAFAVNTPNRVGEYGGRILYLREDNRAAAVALTLIGSMSQTLVTLLAGSGGLIFLLNIPESATLPVQLGPNLFWIRVILYIVVFLSGIGLLFYFQLGWLIRILSRIPVLVRWVRHISDLENVNFLLLLRVLSLSIGRYLVFITQYVLMIRLMEVDVTAWQSFWLSSVSFLIMALIPTIALAEIGIRGKVSLELFGLFSVNTVGIITASIGIWAINLVIPALAGSLLILRIKIFKNK